MAKHGLSVERTAENPQARSREATGPLATGAVLQRPKGYAVPPDQNFGLGHVEDLNPPKAATPEQRAAQLRRSGMKNTMRQGPEERTQPNAIPEQIAGAPDRHSQHPEIAKRWSKEHPNQNLKRLPEHKGDRPKAPPGEVALTPAGPMVPVGSGLVDLLGNGVQTDYAREMNHQWTPETQALQECSRCCRGCC